MYCYAVNGRCTSPCHLWLTGCEGEMGSQLKRLPGFDNWIIEKENRPYIEALQEQKENLVYLTADAETVLEELDPKKIYIVGGLVDHNRWKGITMKKVEEKGIKWRSSQLGISRRCQVPRYGWSQYLPFVSLGRFTTIALAIVIIEI